MNPSEPTPDAAEIILQILQQPAPKTEREKAARRADTNQRFARARKIIGDPAVFAHIGNGKTAARERFIVIAQLRQLGKSWDDIADLLNYKNGKAAIDKYRELSEKFAVSETVNEVRQLHDGRLEMMWQSLLPAIEAEDRGTPRAVEVAIKVLERQARLHGVDAIEEAQTQKGGQQQQAVVINITAHPGDDSAKQLIIEGRSSEVGGGQGSGQILPSSNQSLPEHQEDNFFSRRDGLGENVVRPLLDSKETESKTEE